MKEFRDRVLIPTLVPLAAMAIIAVIVLNISRVLIALEERSGPNTVTALATILSSGILFGFTWYSSRGAEKSAGSLTLMSVAGIMVLIAGYFGAEAIHETEEEERAHAAEQAANNTPDLTVHAFDIGWTEKELKTGPGKVKIQLVNDGATAHTFVLEGLTGKKLSTPGKGDKDLGEFDAAVGTYTYFCDVPGHRQAGMEGKLIVDPAGPAPGAGGGGGGGGAGTPVAIVGTDLKFAPTTATAPAGPVNISLKNDGAIQHNLVIEGQPGFKKLDVAPGASASGTFDAKAGEYILFCDIAGHRPAGMETKLTVT